MQLHPWVITSWPIIELPTDPTLRIATVLQHLGTVVSGECDEFGRLVGHTIWGASDLRIGVAWDWTETLDGVFALSDPMGVVSNIGFVDESGSGVPDTSSAVQMNRITNVLPWQAEVSKATRGLRMDTPWAARIKPHMGDSFRASGLGGLAATHC